jgi:hypothetical protein
MMYLLEQESTHENDLFYFLELGVGGLRETETPGFSVRIGFHLVEEKTFIVPLTG